jgi:putative membrane protein
MSPNAGDERSMRMHVAAELAVGLVALLHLGFLVLEMFFWKRPLGRRIFGLSRELAEASAPLAAHPGLYNGFLAAGLIWGLAIRSAGTLLELFFLSCVVVAGVFGAATANRRILWVQALPGAVAWALVWLAAF